MAEGSRARSRTVVALLVASALAASGCTAVAVGGVVVGSFGLVAGGELMTVADEDDYSVLAGGLFVILLSLGCIAGSGYQIIQSMDAAAGA